MDFRHPFRVVTSTLEGDVLFLLAQADEGFSGRQLHRLLGRASEPGVRKAAERLVTQGIVLRHEVGRAKIYRLNRRHVAAMYIEGLAELRAILIARLRSTLKSWNEPPLTAILFGSAARGEATPQSDIDLLLLRREDIDEDSPVWRKQLSELERDATEWTGNDARVLEYGAKELADEGVAAVVKEAISGGIELFGDSRRRLREQLSRSGR